MAETLKLSRGMRSIVVIVFAALCYFPIFLHLDSRTLREWDEARNAINAFEMDRNHDHFVKHYQGQPDLWETKPPLLVWMQVTCFSIFGYTELAVRLPSAIAAFCLAMFLLNFFYRHFQKPMIGILAVMVLLSSGGYIHDHSVRTGDHDSLLICFEMLMLLSFFMYVETRKQKQLLLSCLFFMLAIYTKSIAIFIFLPGILLYLAVSGNLLSSLKDKKLWIGFLLALGGALLYYLVRESLSTGYLKAVWENELFPRYFNTAKTYKYEVSDFWFYFRELKNSQFSTWFIFLLPAVIINLLSCKDMLRRFHLFILISAVVFFLIISRGTTNTWYDLPLIPLFAMIIGIAMHQLGEMVYERLKINPYLKYFLLSAAFCLVFLQPYASIIRKVMDTDEANTEVQYAYVIKRMEKEYPDIKTFFIYNPSGSNYPLVFYRDVFNLTKNYNISYMYANDLKQDDRYIVLKEEFLPEIADAGVNYTIIIEHNKCYLIRTIPQS
jgi:4-amino-4-deoxy-L-arabinose transferase-like glycosyltransferase